MHNFAAAVERITDIDHISFPKLGLDFTIDPTAFTIFGLDIQWYGIIITIGLLLALVYCFPKMKRFGLDADRAVDAVIGGVLGGIVGARLYYVIMKWEDYKKDTLGETFRAVINTRNGGLAIYGGIIGALVVGLIICKIRKVRFLPMLDITVLGFLIGQGIGRWGNFVNQEAFGSNTDFFLGMTGGRIQDTIIRETQIGGDMYNNGLTMLWEQPVHPCFLYESVWCILGFLLLSFWSKRRKYDGQILLMYMAWYGAERFVVEGLRTDSLMMGNIRISQAVSAVIFIVSVIIQIVMFFRRQRDPESFVLYANTEESVQLIEESRRKRMGVSGADAKIMDSDDDDIGILPDEDDDEAPRDILASYNKAVESVVAAAEANAEKAAADAAEEESKDADASAEEESGDAAAADDDEEPQDSTDTDDDDTDDKYEALAKEHDVRLSGGTDEPHNKNKKHRR